MRLRFPDASTAGRGFLLLPFITRQGGRPKDKASAMDHPEPSTPSPDWNAIARDPDFKALVSRKIKLVVPATVFFIVYYFALPIGVGWFPENLGECEHRLRFRPFAVLHGLGTCPRLCPRSDWLGS